MTTITPSDDFATHAKHSLAKVSVPGDTEPCIDLLTEPPVDGVTEALTCDWEYISILYGKNDKQEMAALMPTQATLTEALRKWTQTMSPLGGYRSSQISADLRNTKPRRDVTKNPMVTKRTMAATDPLEGGSFQCWMVSPLTPVYLMEVTVGSTVGTGKKIRQYPSGSFKSLPRKMLINDQTWIGSQPTRQALSECMAGACGEVEKGDVDSMIHKMRDWKPELKKGAYGRMTDSVALGEDVQVVMASGSTPPHDASVTVFCRVFQPDESERGLSPIFQ